MKKFILLFSVLLLVSDLICELPRTKTIGVDTLSTIRAACAGEDPLTQYYYLDYKGNRREDEETGDEFYDDGIYRETFRTGDYVKQSFLGVINVELNGSDSLYLRNSYRHLTDSTFVNVEGESLYLSIADVIDSLEEEPEGEATYGLVDVFSLAYTLHNLAFIVDMLWWYEDGAYQTALADTLDLLAGWAYLY